MSADVLPGCEPFSHHGSSSGVLVLHGFTGNPHTLRSLGERVAAAGYGVELPRLSGHGTTVEDMNATTWADWSRDAEEAYDALSARCDRVAVVGLSMGGGLGAHLAEVRPAIVGCVLINPVVKALPEELLEGIRQLLDAGVVTAESIGSDIKKPGQFHAAYDATPLAPVLSLSAGLAEVNEGLSTITAPILLLSSREDHVVSPDNGDELVARVSGPVERIWLENSYHVATLDYDQELVESLTLDFLARVLS